MKADHYARLLTDMDRAGVYHAPHGDDAALLAAADTCSFTVLAVDLAGVADKDQLLAALGKGMNFPAWYGHNWDALLDCLTDLSWCPADGYLVLLQHCDGIHGRAEDDFVTLVRLFAEATQAWRDEGRPFWCFIDMQADGIAWLPLL